MEKLMTKTVLITGASSGFGKATAQFFLDRGWNVIATMRTPDAGVYEASDRLKILPLDVTKPESIEKALVDGFATFGGVDVLVNNAGIGFLSALEVTPDSLVREIFETNTFGVIAVCRSIIPHLRKQGHGTIVNVSSSSGIAPMPMVAIYSASKCAIEGFSESLSYELGMFGIKVKLVEPGLAPTTSFGANSGSRMDGMLPSPYDAFAQEYFAKMANYPTDYTSEAEVAEAVFTAATDEDDRVRYPAGADTKLMAKLRWSTSEDEYLSSVREMFGPKLRV
jgi:NAD(P)-dependent dehydrogenase (short-subunit alcohol dehydrogenase family)